MIFLPEESLCGRELAEGMLGGMLSEKRRHEASASFCLLCLSQLVLNLVDEALQLKGGRHVWCVSLPVPLWMMGMYRHPRAGARTFVMERESAVFRAAGGDWRMEDTFTNSRQRQMKQMIPFSAVKWNTQILYLLLFSRLLKLIGNLNLNLKNTFEYSVMHPVMHFKRGG